MKPSLVPLPVGHADPARGDGRFDPPVNCQVAINPVREPGEQFTPLGYRDKDLPYYAAAIHMDGNITMAAAQEAQQGTPEEIYLRHFATGPKGDIGPSPDVGRAQLRCAVPGPAGTTGCDANRSRHNVGV